MCRGAENTTYAKTLFVKGNAEEAKKRNIYGYGIGAIYDDEHGNHVDARHGYFGLGANPTDNLEEHMGHFNNYIWAGSWGADGVTGIWVTTDNYNNKPNTRFIFFAREGTAYAYKDEATQDNIDAIFGSGTSV